MASYPRPSLIIRVAVNDRELTADLAQRIKATYSYVGGTVVSGREPQEVDPSAPNELVLDIRLHRPYWNAGDPAAQDMWENMMVRWLQNIEYKVGATVVNSYERDEERGCGGVPYRWVEFRFDAHAAIAVETDGGTRLPKDLVATLGRIRALMAAGALGADVVRVRIPRPAAADACPSEDEGPVAPEPVQPPVCAVRWTVERADGSSQAFDVERGCLVEG